MYFLRLYNGKPLHETTGHKISAQASHLVLMNNNYTYTISFYKISIDPMIR